MSRGGILSSLSSLAGELVAAATDLATSKTELEKKLDEALSNKNWGASNTLLREIANATGHQCAQARRGPRQRARRAQRAHDTPHDPRSARTSASS